MIRTKAIISILFQPWDFAGLSGTYLMYAASHPYKALAVILGAALTVTSIYEKFLQIKKLRNEKRGKKHS